MSHECDDPIHIMIPNDRENIALPPPQIYLRLWSEVETYTSYIRHQPLAWVISDGSAGGPTDGPTGLQTEGQTTDELTD